MTWNLEFTALFKEVSCVHARHLNLIESAVLKVPELLFEKRIVVDLDHGFNWRTKPHLIVSNDGPGLELGEHPRAVSS